MSMIKTQLFSKYNIAKAAVNRSNMFNKEKMLDRLNKAFAIIQTREYYVGDRVEYTPSAYSCGCKDWEFRFAHKRAYIGPCKHMLAEILIEMIIEDHDALPVSIIPTRIHQTV